MTGLWLPHAVAALAAGFGAVLRFILDGVISARLARRKPANPMPWGIIAVNLSGSFLIGVVAGMVADGAFAAGSWPQAAGAGLLGGYTTFSTASHQTVQLALSGRWVAAALNGLGQFAVAVAFVVAGWGVALLILG